MQTRTSSDPPVVVIGAGLAGLAAGAAAARAGSPVIILDARSPGGRARTEIRDGFRFNQGPHALYRAGPGRRVLSRLGIKTTGHPPRLRGSQALVGGRPRSFPKTQVARTIARLAVTSATRHAGRSASEWIGSLRLRRDDARYLAAFIRNTSYVADLDQMPADLAIAQMRTALRGVDYLDGGWQQLTAGLLSCVSAAGAQVCPHARADHIEGTPGAWEVHAGGAVIRAAAVVVAVGRPAAARRLLPVDPGWENMGSEVTAACLDLGLRRPGAPYTLGIDEPLYLSPHSPPGDLAPAGCELVHAMRYGASSPAADCEQLWRLAASAGISKDDVVAERFLPRMIVVNCLPSPQRGLAGRPSVTVPGTPGLFLAGDWIGPQGWLCDGSLASGERSGLLAARAAQDSSSPRMARRLAGDSRT
jgi:glycine/D-amino acid oxidase-like deaminating enzyme